MPWTEAQIADQTGKTFLITGANSGIGYEAARMLAAKGARVILACRSEAKATEAMGRIRAETPGARLEFQALDLASLASVRAAAAQVPERFGDLDVLVNNAGIMAIPRTLTADGFEMQIGTNHLGHFALTGLLWRHVRGRIVHVSSMAHRMGKLTLDDLMRERSYARWSVYGQSKLANLLFHYELQRRLAAAGQPQISVACHPGYSDTNLQAVGPQMDGSSIAAWGARWANRLLAQPAPMGALPTVFAAVEPSVQGGDYIGPDGFNEWWGHPKKVTSNARSHDEASQRGLWARSEELTGVAFGI